MKRMCLFIAVFMGIILFAGSAFSGVKESRPIVGGVYPSGVIWFAGAIGSVRNSADDFQNIGCRDNGTFAQCWASDSEGKSVSCVTTDATHLSVVRGMDDSSYIRVSIDRAGNCSTISSNTESRWEPKEP